MKKTLTITLTIVLLLIFVLVPYYILNNKKDNNNTNKEDIINRLKNMYGSSYINVAIENNIINEKELKEYVKLIPFLGEYNKMYKDAYSGNKVTVVNIKSTIVYLTIKKSPSLTNVSKTMENILKEHKLLSKNEKDVYFILYDTATLETKLSKYNLSIKEIKEINIPFGKVIYISDDYTVAKLTKKEKEKNNIKKIAFSYIARNNNDDLLIYENALFIEEKDNKYNVYKNTFDINNNTKIIKPFDAYNNNNLITYDDIIKNNEEYLNKESVTYKHTFKKNNNSYYWYSSEIVE